MIVALPSVHLSGLNCQGKLVCTDIIISFLSTTWTFSSVFGYHFFGRLKSYGRHTGRKPFVFRRSLEGQKILKLLYLISELKYRLRTVPGIFANHMNAMYSSTL